MRATIFAFSFNFTGAMPKSTVICLMYRARQRLPEFALTFDWLICCDWTYVITIALLSVPCP